MRLLTKSKLIFALLGVLLSFYIQQAPVPLTTAFVLTSDNQMSTIKPYQSQHFTPLQVVSVFNNCNQYLSIFEQYNWNLDSVLRICQAESSGNPMATNYNANGSIDRGILQINSIHGDMFNFNFQSLYTPSINAKIAYQIYQARGWCAWSTSITLGLCYN